MKHFLTLFHQTVEPYLHPDFCGTQNNSVFTSEDRENIQLKVDHTLRVLAEAEKLAEYAPDDHTGYLLKVAALFHDIGRFTQYSKYKTFRDADSVDHAREAIKVIRTKKLLARLPLKDRAKVMIAIRTHNMKAVPPRLSVEQSYLCKGVRDCDKLDIYPVLIGNFKGTSHTSPVVCHGAKDEPEMFTQEIYTPILHGQLADYSKIEWLNDFKLLLVSWVYDLNFAHTAREVQKRGYIETLFSLLPDTKPMHELEKQVQQTLRDLS
ncbi:MAG: HD domain-containing protein [Desulfovibrio sp.]